MSGQGSSKERDLLRVMEHLNKYNTTYFSDRSKFAVIEHGWMPREDFSWYEGEPNKKVIADIVRLRREGKLGTAQPPGARPSGLAEMMEYAARQIDQWPADVRVAMGIKELWTRVDDRNGEPDLSVLTPERIHDDERRYYLVPASPLTKGEGR